MSFWNLIRILTRRKWVIAGIVISTVLVILFAAPNPKIKYSATALMTPTAQAMRGGAANTANTTDSKPERTVILSNLVILAKSSEVKRRASDFLALPANKQRMKTPGLPSYKQIRINFDESNSAANGFSLEDALEVTPVVNATIGDQGTISDIIAIKVSLPNGNDAPFLANAIGVAFMNAYRQKSLEDINKYNSFLISGTRDAKKTLDALDARVAAYNRRHRLAQIDLETQGAITALTGTESTRDSVQAEVSEASATLSDLDRQLRQQPLVRNDSLPGEMNPKVEKLQQDLTKAEDDLRETALRYRPNHPAYQAIDGRVTFLRGEIERESRNYTRPVINELHNELIKQRSLVANRLSAARAKLAVLNSQVRRAQSRVSAISGSEVGLTALMRERQGAADQYALFKGRLAQARVADKEFEKYGSIIPYDWSQNAVGPIIEGPSKKALAIYGFILALIFSIAGVVWLDSIDNRLRGRYDAEKLLGLPIAGLIPAITGKDGQLPRLTHMYPLSPMAEAYRMLRTDLLFTQRDNDFKTLMVATGKPGQGATTTICNLAIALAQVGKRVILIDADMRRPSLHKFFDLKNDAGLSTLLKGNGNPMDCIRKTVVENLIVIPAGPTPLNASELLASSRMQDIVEQLKQHFDFVLFDTPSTIVFSDGQILSSWLDAVLFVVSANQVPRDSEKLAIEKLRKAKANIIGSVVNRMPPDAVDSAYYYSHYYATDNMNASVEVLADTGKQPTAIDKNTDEELAIGNGKSKKPASITSESTVEPSDDVSI
ncbi:MAG: polysaccharide biosynthesis tyrosine autokinase [Armatimonadota bacterium]